MKYLLFLSTAACAVWAQSKPGLHARELFYAAPPQVIAETTPAAAPATAPAPTSPAKPAEKKTAQAQPAPKKKAAPAPTPAPQVAAAPAAPAAVPLGLRYSVLKRDAAGDFVEVDPASNFHSGDRIRVQVEANSSGYLYVVSQGSSGTWQPLFPASAIAGGSNHIERGEKRTVPPGGQFMFDEKAGTEKLFLVLSRQPQADLDQLIYAVGGPQKGAGAAPVLLASSSVSDEVVEKLRQQIASRDLVFEKVDSADSTGKVENAAYVVNPSASADARLVVDLALSHR
jgi:hypothetical protein